MVPNRLIPLCTSTNLLFFLSFPTLLLWFHCKLLTIFSVKIYSDSISTNLFWNCIVICKGVPHVCCMFGWKWRFWLHDKGNIRWFSCPRNLIVSNKNWYEPVSGVISVFYMLKISVISPIALFHTFFKRSVTSSITHGVLLLSVHL